MRKRQHKKLIHEGNYVAEVEVDLIDTDEGWSPVISLDEAQKLDDVREALREVKSNKPIDYVSAAAILPREILIMQRK